MLRYVREIKRIMQNGGRKDIRAKILRLIGSVGLIILMTGGIFSLLAMGSTWHFIEKQSKTSGEEIAEYTKEFVEEKTREKLHELKESKVQTCDSELQRVLFDIEYIAYEMQKILSEPENYEMRIISDTRRQKIRQGEVYLHYVPSIAENLTIEMEKEMKIASNVENILETIYDVAYTQAKAHLRTYIYRIKAIQ